MIVQTLPDLNAILTGCGCCPMPLCPVPVLDCQSLAAQAWSSGANRRTEDGEFVYFRDKTITRSISVSGSVTEEDDRIGEWIAFTQESSATTSEICTYDPLFDASCCLRSETVAEEMTFASIASGTVNSYNLVGSIPSEGYTPSCLRHRYLSRSIETNREIDTVTGTVTDHVTQTLYEPDGSCGSGEIEESSYDVVSVYATQSWPGFSQYSSQHSEVSTSTPPDTIAYTDVGYAAMVAAMAAKLAPWLSFTDPENATCLGTDCRSSKALTSEEDAKTANIDLDLQTARYRWRIPATWPGSYFKITWQALTVPDAGAPTLGEDQTWTWAGPGDPEDAEHESWFSPWYELAPPDVPGTRRVVNIRYECYRSARTGTCPQITGEGYALPAP